MDTFKQSWLDALYDYLIINYKKYPRDLANMSISEVMDEVEWGTDCCWCDFDGLDDWLFEIVDHDWNETYNYYEFYPKNEYEQELLDVYEYLDDYLTNHSDYPYYLIQVNPDIIIVTPEEVQQVINRVLSDI